MPRGSTVIRGVRGGLLLSDMSAQSAAFVWNPVTRRTIVRIPGDVIDATDNLVAWRGLECTLAACTLHVTDLTSGGRRDYANRAGVISADGAISPDGRRLVLSEFGDPSPAENGNLTSVVVIVFDLRSGSRVTVPGSKIANGGGFAAPGYYAVGWSPDSRYVVLLTRGQPALWAVGKRELWLTPPLPPDAAAVPS